MLLAVVCGFGDGPNDAISLLFL